MEGLQVTRELEFIGYNDRMAPEALKPGYLEDALNVFMVGGKIVKRTGYTAVGASVGSYACQGMKGVRFADGTKRIYGVFNGTIYYSTGGNWTSLGGTLSTSAQVDIVVANNAVYFFDGANTVPKVASDNTLSTVAAIPIGFYARWEHNQLHVAGMTANPNRLQSSDIGNPESFSGGNSSSLDINPNDGDLITGLGYLKDELLVFKQNRTFSMTGFGTSALTLANVNERATGVGTRSHRSIVNTGNSVMYVSFFGNKVHIRAIRRTSNGVLYDDGIASADIETSLDGMNEAQLSRVAAIFDGRNAWFAFPASGSSVNNRVFVYDIFTKGWVRFTGINASVFDSFSLSNTPQLYFGDSGDNGRIHVFDSSTSDNGTAINFSVKSRRYGGLQPEHKNKFKWLYVGAKESGDYDITVDYSVDGFSYANLGTLNLSGTGSIFDMIVLDQSRLGTTDAKRERFTFPKTRNYYLQFHLYDTSATSSVEIRNWELLLYPIAPIDA